MVDYLLIEEINHEIKNYSCLVLPNILCEKLFLLYICCWVIWQHSTANCWKSHGCQIVTAASQIRR